MTRLAAMAVIASSALAAGAIAIAACLPDLVVAQVPPAPPVCGDGIVQPDAGEECDPAGGAPPGCASCKIACDGGYVDDASLHCYWDLPAQTTSPDTAQANCQDFGGYVVTFASERELGFVATNAPTGPFWVGLRQTGSGTDTYLTVGNVDEPGWSPTCPGCYAHVDPGTTITKGAKLAGNCVDSERDTSKPWHASICQPIADASVTREAICERDPPGTRAEFCGGGFVCFTVPATLGRKRYVLEPAPSSASDAEATCASTFGKHLVVFESAEEREQVASVVSKQTVAPVRTFWIGLATSNGAWAWDDPSGLGSLPWGVAEPALDASAGRAYVARVDGGVDSELAHAGDATDAGGETHPFVCEW